MVRTRAKKVQNGDAGFTIIELVAAVAITTLLGIAIISVIIGVLDSNGKTQINAATTVKAQHALTNFEQNVKQAEEIVSASKHSVQFFYRANNRCEFHTYQFAPDQNLPQKLSLVHTIRSGFVPGTVDCSALSDSILSRSIGVLTERIELENLGAGSRFFYYGDNSAQIPRPGDADFRIRDQVNPCQITAIQIMTRTTAIAGDSTYENEDSVWSSIQANAKGVSCRN